MDVFLDFTKYFRCGFDTLASRFRRLDDACHSKAEQKGVSRIIRNFLGKQSTNSFFGICFYRKKKLRREKKRNISLKHATENLIDQHQEEITVNQVCTSLPLPGTYAGNGAWHSIFVDLAKKGSMTYLIFVDKQTLYPEVFELGMRSLWKQTKYAFRDIFREYCVPKEVFIPKKSFFSTSKFDKFMKNYGIVTSTESPEGNSKIMTKIVSNVKSLINNSRFWHEELRNLRECISKSLLITDDKCVQVDDDVRLSSSGSSSAGSSSDSENCIASCAEKANNAVTLTLPDFRVKKSESDVIRTKLNQYSYNTEDTKDLKLDNLRCFSMGNCYEKIPFSNNHPLIVNLATESMSYLLPRNVKCFAIDEHYFPASLKFKKNRSQFKRKNLIFLKKTVVPYLLKGNRLIMGRLYIARNCTGNISELRRENSKQEQANSNILSKRNKISFKLNSSGSGVGSNVNSVSTGCSAASRLTEKHLIKYPIEILPLKYNNLFLTQRDLNWKVIAVDFLTFSSNCLFIFVDCATKLPEISQLFKKESNKGNGNVKLFLSALRILWQKHGKPIEIHSPSGKIFSSSKFNRFIQKYNILLYYDSPFLKGDMGIGQVLQSYRKLFEGSCEYMELLQKQRKVRRIILEGNKREIDKKRHKTLFSLNNTTCTDYIDVSSNSSSIISSKTDCILRNINRNPFIQLLGKTL